MELYSEPPIPVLPVDEQVPVLEDINEQIPVLVPSPLREVTGSPVWDDSSSFLASPVGSVYGPITSPISPSLWTTDVSRPLSDMATMDQSLPRDYTTFIGVGGRGSSAQASDPPSDCRGDGSGNDWGFPDRGACCCELTVYAGLVSRGTL